TQQRACCAEVEHRHARATLFSLAVAFAPMPNALFPCIRVSCALPAMGRFGAFGGGNSCRVIDVVATLNAATQTATAAQRTGKAARSDLRNAHRAELL